MNSPSTRFISDFHPAPGPLPRHVGIIPDGGRRWSVEHGCTLMESYEVTRNKLQKFVILLLENGVKEVSIYLSSIQNFRRSTDDLGANLDIIRASMDREIIGGAIRKNLRVVIAGDTRLIPGPMRTILEKVATATANHTGGNLNLLIGYDPIRELQHAIKQAPEPEQFLHYLWVTTPVDLIMRSGDAPLLSNFLPLQSGYARLHFFNKLFNDLTQEDIRECLAGFASVERKFGE